MYLKGILHFMTKTIQIAPLKGDFQRIIDFDRKNPSDKIVVFVTKCDTNIKNKKYKKIEESLSNLRNYCQLTRIGFNMQVIDFSNKKNFLNVIFEFTKSFLLDYEQGDSYRLNLGDSSLILNMALLHASIVIKVLHNIDISAHLEDICCDVQVNFEYPIIKSFESLISPPVTLRLLTCIDQGRNFTEIEKHYSKNKIKMSMGTISNHITQLENLDLVSGKRVSNRVLTNLGILVKEIFELTKTVS